MNHRFTVIIIALLLLIPCIYSDSDSVFISIYYGDYDESLFETYIDIPIVAVISDNSGIVGRVRIAKLKTKNNIVVFDTRTDIDPSTVESVLDAIRYVEKASGKSNDYFVSYDLRTNLVSGKSTGASVALGMSALSENKNYNPDYIISGNIDVNGDLLNTGGLLTKIISVSNSPSSNIILNQKNLIMYEKYDNKLLAKEIDLEKYSENIGLNLITISNLDEAKTLILNEKV